MLIPEATPPSDALSGSISLHFCGGRRDQGLEAYFRGHKNIGLYSKHSDTLTSAPSLSSNNPFSDQRLTIHLIQEWRMNCISILLQAKGTCLEAPRRVRRRANNPVLSPQALNNLLRTHSPHHMASAVLRAVVRASSAHNARRSLDVRIQTPSFIRRQHANGNSRVRG